MSLPDSQAAPGRARRMWAAACLAAGFLAAGCATTPVALDKPQEVRSLEVSIKDVPPMEAYYYRRQPPGVLGYLGTAAFMGSNIYRSWADSEWTERYRPHARMIKPAEEVMGPFLESLKKAGVFRRVDIHKVGEAPTDATLYDAKVEILLDRWGMTYAAEGKVSAEVVVEGRMRPYKGEELLWRRRIVETDGARTEMERLAEDGRLVEDSLRRTLRAAGVDLARDLLIPYQGSSQPAQAPKELLPPPEM